MWTWQSFNGHCSRKWQMGCNQHLNCRGHANAQKLEVFLSFGTLIISNIQCFMSLLNKSIHHWKPFWFICLVTLSCSCRAVRELKYTVNSTALNRHQQLLHIRNHVEAMSINGESHRLAKQLLQGIRTVKFKSKSPKRSPDTSVTAVVKNSLRLQTWKPTI